MNRFFIVSEIQQDANGNVAVLTTPKTDYNEALSTYYSVCAAAAISTIPYHAATIFEDSGIMKMCQIFDRRAED